MPEPQQDTSNGKSYEPANRLVARTLGVSIVTGHRPPGEVLPTELELATAFGLSRSVIREALRTLAAKGLIESRPKAGTRVRARGAWQFFDPELLEWMFEGAPPLAFVRSLFELRLIIEPAAAEIAAARRTDVHVTAMDQALQTMAKHGLATAQGQAGDQDFHRLLLEATNNELLATLAGGIMAAVRWTTIFKYRTKRHPRDPIPQHRVLFEAIARSDPTGARDATANLIRQAERDTEISLSS